MPYDENEKYVRVALPAISPEIPEGSGKEAHVPLSVQENAYRGWGPDASVRRARFLDFIRDHWGEIEALGCRRLRDNYERYGSQMYGWDAEERRRNIIEELADARVYLSSGAV